MAYLPLKKLLSEYFQKPDLQEACRKIDEPTSYTNPELEQVILREWVRHGNNKYDLFAILDKQTLSRICDAYNLDYRGSKQELLKRIKKKKLLDDPKKPIKITGGVGLVILSLFLALYGAGIDTLDLMNYFTTEETSMDLECVSGEFGLTIRDCEAGFKITRPNYDWVRTTDINLYNRQQGDPEIKVPSYLGGISLGKLDEGGVSINVFDTKNLSNENPLEGFVIGFHQGLKSNFPNVTIEEPYFVGETAVIELQGVFKVKPLTIKVKIEEHNEKFYILSTSFGTDMKNLDDFLSERDQVIDSFNYTD